MASVPEQRLTPGAAIAADPWTNATFSISADGSGGDSKTFPGLVGRPAGPGRTDTHGVVLPDVTPDVQQQLVADVDGEVDGPHAAGGVTASHQAGLQPRALKHR